MSTSPILTIGAPGFDVDQLVAELQATTERKTKEGAYADARVARAEKTNLIHLRGSEDFVIF